MSTYSEYMNPSAEYYGYTCDYDCDYDSGYGYGYGFGYGYKPEELDASQWFIQAGEDNTYVDFRVLQNRDREDLPHRAAKLKQLDSPLPFKDSWIYYRGLLQVYEDSIVANSDVEALKFGLKQSTSLKRITITPVTHGFLFTPLYKTPMIRSFPVGFNYPPPRGWPTRETQRDPPRTPPWPVETKNWRGFSVVTRVLAKDHIRQNAARPYKLIEAITKHIRP